MIQIRLTDHLMGNDRRSLPEYSLYDRAQPTTSKFECTSTCTSERLLANPSPRPRWLKFAIGELCLVASSISDSSALSPLTNNVVTCLLQKAL